MLGGAAQTRPVALQHARVFTGSGAGFSELTLIFQDGEFTAVGATASPSLLARKVDLGGRYVTPGFIDAYGSTALRLPPAGGGPLGRAADAFDRYAEHEFRSAWQDGITAVYLPARTSSGFGGLGAVVRLRPRWDDCVLQPEGYLHATFGRGAGDEQGPLARVRVMEEVLRRFRAAREYRDAWNEYEDNLKEYEKKLGEQSKSAPKENPGAALDGSAPGQPEARRRGGKKDEQPEELKKPAEPNKERQAELLLRALDGELRVEIEAHDPADILNALAMAAELNLALVIAGGSGAHLVARELAAQHVPVVLAGPPASLAFTPTQRDARPDAAALLSRAGVDVYFASGANGATESPQLTLAVARAVGAGFDEDEALRRLTSGAARLLGVEADVGRLAVGLQADLVVWTDHPFAPGARVERVYIGGAEVYRADAAEEDEP